MNRSTGLAVLTALWIALAPVLAYSPEEEKLVRQASQGMDGLAAAEAALAPGTLSSVSRTLSPLLRMTETPAVRSGMEWLLERKLLPDAGISYLLHEGHEACGPYRHVTRTVFRSGTVSLSTPFFLYQPATGEYSIGGVLIPGQLIDVLVRREDGTFVGMLPDGRVAFLPERTVRVAVNPSVSVLSAGQVVASAERDGYSYSAIHVGRAFIHLVRIDLDRLPMSMAVSPFFNALGQGPERVQPVDGMAKKYGAKVAINGTFFIDQSSNPQYGFPIGSAMIGGKLAWSLRDTNLLRFERSYAAQLDDGRLVLGHTALSGDAIRGANLAGQFDPQRIGTAKIVGLCTGFGWLIRDKKADAWKTYAGKQFDASYYSRFSHRARSLVGVDVTGHQAFVVAEEEGPNSPEPLSLPDLAEWIENRAKVNDLVFLDGGGSTQLVIEGKNVSGPADGSYRKNSTAVLFVPR